METSLSLGLAYEDVLDTATAAEFYERCVGSSKPEPGSRRPFPLPQSDALAHVLQAR